MEKTFTYDRLPQNVEELKALSDLRDAFEVASLVVLVLAAYEHDVEEMIKMYDYINGPVDVSKYQRQFIDDRLKGKEYVARSYFNGTSPKITILQIFLMPLRSETTLILMMQKGL